MEVIITQVIADAYQEVDACSKFFKLKGGTDKFVLRSIFPLEMV
jgi:hypothetical protein